MTATHAPGPIKAVRIPKSDMDAAAAIAPPRLAASESSRRFAVMGAAILEKLCRSGNLAIHAKRTTPYVLDTVRGRIAVSVMVSAVSGDPATKHMVVPLTSLSSPPGVVGHVIVCAFVSKLERIREKNGGLNVKLAGWATAAEAAGYAREVTRVDTCIRIAAVPVAALHPIQTLRHYLTPPTKGESCEHSSQQPSSPAQQPSADATRRSSTPTSSSTGPSSSGLTAP